MESHQLPRWIKIGGRWVLILSFAAVSIHEVGALHTHEDHHVPDKPAVSEVVQGTNTATFTTQNIDWSRHFET